ncbi:MAG: alpha/beta fold hydrolase [Pelagimonas sp.]|uniref:alpha/beta fold hydrolase n=1 Tax=Pelagimonas sp. TaxID=2073170 RepID=UPI003D6BF67D
MNNWQLEEVERDVVPSELPAGDAGAFEDLSAGRTYYELDEPSDKPLLVCIHGWSTASYAWRELRPKFQEKGYRVLTYDLYGRGYSERPPGKQSVEFFTQHLSELLERLQLDQVQLNVVGYSMGGAIAARFVSERLEQVDRLLLIAPAGTYVKLPVIRFVTRNLPRIFDPVFYALAPARLSKEFSEQAKNHLHNDAVKCALARQLGELNYRGYLPALLSSLKGALANSMAIEHRNIAASNVAVRAIFAGNDATITHPRAKKRFDMWNRNSVCRTFEDAGHGVAYTYVDQLIVAVEDFL